MKHKKVLLNPGPVSSTESIRQALMAEDICPKEDEFINLMKDVRKKLCEVVHADYHKYDAVLYCGSGTLVLEAVLVSMLPANKKVLMLENGTYAHKSMNIPKAYNLDYVHVEGDILEPLSVEKVKAALEADPEIALVYVTHHETGTGVLNPIREIGELAHQHGAMLMVDGVSSYGLLDIDMDKDHVDFLIAGAQKGLYAMTGLSFVIGKRELIEASKEHPMRLFYAHLYSQYNILNTTGDMRFTPPVQLVYAANQALDELLAEGVENRMKRTQALHDHIRKHVKRLGFRETLPVDYSGRLICALDYPDGVDFNFKHFHDYLYARDFTIFPFPTGKPKTFRVSAIGNINQADLDEFFKLIEDYWNEQGWSIPILYQ